MAGSPGGGRVWGVQWSREGFEGRWDCGGRGLGMAGGRGRTWGGEVGRREGVGGRSSRVAWCVRRGWWGGVGVVVWGRGGEERRG